ncbi:3-aminobutyryl-CoA ammonia lyase [Vulcanimicrobium alpinum]|uniref:3-aminobutyryl-CoA ammonia lyase n=1 Tax=Vulcanimicrobium alpinum TaxID=3016050 RepID=A0AAN1XYH8_UNVUL|nr:hotdog domain-containing protein [Vulcanimicrobium alpinum]BDE07699.1 3-aminobutyryl-CoA ammonia lyase [Vulcanimicrobium alpinum]
MIRVRMSAHDAHYGGSLVDGARILGLFGDVATELLIRRDGDEGLFVAYDLVEFKAPVYAGDYIEARGRITKTGATSRTMEFEAHKVIAARTDLSPSAADVLAEPLLVVRARGTCVTPAENQRRGDARHRDLTKPQGNPAAVSEP